MSKQALVIYHDNCADGIMSAAIAKMHMPDAEFFACNYNRYEMHHDFIMYADDQVNFTDKDVFILDFSFKHAEILQIASLANEVTLLDHHKSAQADLEGKEFPKNTEITFDMQKAGCWLTWENWHGKMDHNMPRAAYLIGLRDVWKHKGTEFELDAEAINYWLFSEPLTIDRAHHILNSHTMFQIALTEGRAIHKFFRQKVEDAKRNARSIIYGASKSYSLATCNAPYWLASELGNQLSHDHDFACVWFMDAKGEIGVSLRSSKGFDVSMIAKKYGGGGHAAAAGCKFNTYADFAVSGLL